MRIVAVADTHLYHRELVVPDGDVFVHAGDLCRGGSLTELDAAARWIRGLPHAIKIVIAGNHDWCFVREPAAAREVLGPGIVYLEDSGHAVAGVQFWGSPWQPEFGGWAFNLPRGPKLAEKWAKIPADTTVLITHGPPEGSAIVRGRRRGLVASTCVRASNKCGRECTCSATSTRTAARGPTRARPTSTARRGSASGRRR